MKVQVLVATMLQKDFSKVREMNIKSDAFYANQSDEYSYIEKEYEFGKVKMLTTPTHGVGLNRNLALLHAEGDYLVFSDDDVCYVNDYDKIIEKAFMKIPDADVLIFNIKPLYGHYFPRINSKIKRIHIWNAMSYGAIRIVAKRTSLKRENIMFNLNFGGGTEFSSGEDTMFIMDMLRKGLKIYTYPEYIAYFDDDVEKSSWFTGYNEKYYYDKGVFFGLLSKKNSKILCLQDLLRHYNNRKNSKLDFKTAYYYMKMGIKGCKELITFDEYLNLK